MYYIKNSSYYYILFNKLNESYHIYEKNHRAPYKDTLLKLPEIIELKIARNISLTNNKNCKVIIATLSSPHNFRKRYSFRRIFYKYNKIKNVKLIFFIGKSEYENKHLLYKEFFKYNDLVQFDYHNSYFNLTLLSIMALKYCSLFFSSLKYYIKTDDDMLLNYKLLDSLLKTIHPYDNQIYGHLNGKFIANRNNYSNTYIPYFQYQYKYVPKYVYGGLIIIPESSLKKIYNQTLFKQKYVWKEDVNIGILCNQAGINVKQFPCNIDIKIKEKICKLPNKIIALEYYLSSDGFYCF